MALPTETKKRFRSLGHGLKPVVTIAGKGLSESVLTELSRALDDHELIKIKLVITDRDTRKQLVEELCKQSRATLVQEIGKVALIYRESRNQPVKASNAR
ncbi:MAG: ribosome assembly RNA-binding protein YhbY [Alteromonadaceae bacterium]|nr:MAG: ribosome assembly RNA-binding protein YhbY [Alteromonadaceae bacterium]